MLSNLGTKITYQSIKEDSINIVVNNKVAHARFVALIDAIMDGKPQSVPAESAGSLGEEKEAMGIICEAGC